MIKASIKRFLKKLPGFRKLAEMNQRIRHLEALQNEYAAQITKYEQLLQNEYVVRMIRCEQLLNEHAQQLSEIKMQNELVMESVDKIHGNLLRITQAFPVDRPRLAVYTVLTGNYDKLRTPMVVEAGCDYYCITDNRELKSSFWKMIYVENAEGLDSVRLQRKMKILPHLYFPQYTHSLYIDASILIRESVWNWIDRNSTGLPLLTYQHPERDCVYQEAEACKFLNKDKPELIDRQIERYRMESYPEHNGMVWSAIMYRKHMEPEVIAVENAWFNELLKDSRRDQLSFNYVSWKNHFEYDACKEDYHMTYLWAVKHDGLPR